MDFHSLFWAHFIHQHDKIKRFYGHRNWSGWSDARKERDSEFHVFNMTKCHHSIEKSFYICVPPASIFKKVAHFQMSPEDATIAHSCQHIIMFLIRCFFRFCEAFFTGEGRICVEHPVLMNESSWTTKHLIIKTIKKEPKICWRRRFLLFSH